MNEILIENPILLLFVVASLGYLLGSIRIRGNSLGTAAILFTGLFFGALDPRFDIPEIILQIGLSLFVYSVGLSSGPAFFNSYRKNGFQDFGFIIAMLVFSGVIATGLWALFGFSAAAISGIYSGSTTNTAALAGLLDLIGHTYTSAEGARFTEDVVIGYSFSYPMGVLGGMIAIVVMQRLLSIDFRAEEKILRRDYPLDEGLMTRTVRITNTEICNIQLRDLFQKYNWSVIFGRIEHQGKVSLTNWNISLAPGDFVLLLGSEEELDEITTVLGETATHEWDKKDFDTRRIFVSNPKVVGRTIASLNLNEKFDAQITRIRRGDIDMLAKSDTILELGDRVRFIARRKDLDQLSALFGDSYQESSKINLFSFGLGIGLGLILGSMDISLGSDISFKLGYAGGPLVVGLILGALRRTGPVVWSLPFSANITLQQLGLILLLASIGVRSGGAFVQSLSLEAVWIILASAIISLLTAFAILFVGYKWVRKPFTLLMGMVSNQPAILDFAINKANNRIPEFGFTLMFPIALISKILIAQILFLLLR